MTSDYIATRLLQHGGLTFCKFTEITGWRPRKARSVIQGLMCEGLVAMSGKRGSYSRLPIYSLTGDCAVKEIRDEIS